MYRNVKHFANLTPLRFVAAYLVVLFHIEETREMFHMPNLTRLSMFGHGPMAVTFFFVLSGFLITYLLLREGGHSRQVNLRRFYLRRALRIWPVYFLMVLIGLVLIPVAAQIGRMPYESPYEPQHVVLYFILFLPFVVNLQYGNHFLTPLWSVGVEEIYYLGWGPVVKAVHRLLPSIMICIIAIKAVIAALAQLMSAGPQVVEILRMLQFDAMAWGGLGAYFIFHRQRPLDAHWLFCRPVQVVVIAFLGVHLIAHKSLAAASPLYSAVFNNDLLTPLIMMVVFAWLVVNVAANRGNVLRLDSRLSNYLGDISYGIYMYHALAISLVYVPFLREYQAAPTWVSTLLLHVLVIGLTILMAAISKRFFEDRFLRLKEQLAPAGAHETTRTKMCGTSDDSTTRRAA